MGMLNKYNLLHVWDYIDNSRLYLTSILVANKVDALSDFSVCDANVCKNAQSFTLWKSNPYENMTQPYENKPSSHVVKK